MRNALAHAGRSGRRVVSAFIATAFAQDDAEAAKTQWRRVADQLRPKVPKLATLMDEAEPDVLAYMRCVHDFRRHVLLVSQNARLCVPGTKLHFWLSFIGSNILSFPPSERSCRTPCDHVTPFYLRHSSMPTISGAY
jgi:hypothetical protein